MKKSNFYTSISHEGQGVVYKREMKAQNVAFAVVHAGTKEDGGLTGVITDHEIAESMKNAAQLL